MEITIEIDGERIGGQRSAVFEIKGAAGKDNNSIRGGDGAGTKDVKGAAGPVIRAVAANVNIGGADAAAVDIEDARAGVLSRADVQIAGNCVAAAALRNESSAGVSHVLGATDGQGAAVDSVDAMS